MSVGHAQGFPETDPAPSSAHLGAPDFRQRQRRPWQGCVHTWVTSGGEPDTHTSTHRGTPSCLGRVKLALTAHGDPVWVPFRPLTNALGSSAPSYFLLWLISSLTGRSWSSTPVTQPQILNWSGLALESSSHLSGHYRSFPEPGWRLTTATPLQQGKARPGLPAPTSLHFGPWVPLLSHPGPCP